MVDVANSGMTPEKKAIIPAVIPSPVKVFTSNIGRGRPPTLRWEGAEWDLIECERVLDTEAYFRRATRVKKNLFLKEGWGFTGANPERIQYIKRRLLQMEFATKVPFPVLLSQTVSSLIRLSNAFWIKVRKESASGGKIRLDQDGKKLNPVAGYFLAPAHSIRFKRDEFGRITEYAQEISGKEGITFKPEDVIHWYFDKREGFGIGTPTVVPVIDDIRALRRIEENLELLVYQHLFPLFHYQVGTPEAPAAMYSDGMSEIDVVKLNVATMPSDGCWVTPERHKITPLQASSSPVAVDKVIEHFKQRIFTGLGVSPIDMGEGGTASRSTAQTLSRNLIDDTKADQREFGALFYSYVIQELLLESTFPEENILDEENKVFLSFNEIDLESRISKDNHYVDMFLKNAVTHDELRKEIGKEPFTGKGWYSTGDGDFIRTNYGLIERDKIILQSIDEPGTSEAKAMTASSANAAKMKVIGPSASGGEGAIENKLRPANQHGNRPAPKLNKDTREQNRIPALDIIYKQLPFEEIFKDTSSRALTSDWPMR